MTLDRSTCWYLSHFQQGGFKVSNKTGNWVPAVFRRSAPVKLWLYLGFDCDMRWECYASGRGSQWYHQVQGIGSENYPLVQQPLPTLAGGVRMDRLASRLCTAPYKFLSKIHRLNEIASRPYFRRVNMAYSSSDLSSCSDPYSSPHSSPEPTKLTRGKA